MRSARSTTDGPRAGALPGRSRALNRHSGQFLRPTARPTHDMSEPRRKKNTSSQPASSGPPVKEWAGQTGRRRYVTTGPRNAWGPIRRRVVDDSAYGLIVIGQPVHACSSPLLTCPILAYAMRQQSSKLHRPDVDSRVVGAPIRRSIWPEMPAGGSDGAWDSGAARARRTRGLTASALRPGAWAQEDEARPCVAGVGSGAADGPPRKQHLPSSFPHASAACACLRAAPAPLYPTLPGAGDPLRPWCPAGVNVR